MEEPVQSFHFIWPDFSTPESSDKFWQHWPISTATFALHLTVSLFTAGSQIDPQFPFSLDS